MATTLAPRSALPPSSSTVEDPFHDPLLWGIGITFVLLLVMILVLTGVVYWGVSVRTPGWNANSFPAPLVH